MLANVAAKRQEAVGRHAPMWIDRARLQYSAPRLQSSGANPVLCGFRCLESDSYGVCFVDVPFAGAESSGPGCGVALPPKSDHPDGRALLEGLELHLVVCTCHYADALLKGNLSASARHE